MEALTKPSNIGTSTASVIMQGEIAKMNKQLMHQGEENSTLIYLSHAFAKTALGKKRLMFRGTERWRTE